MALLLRMPIHKVAYRRLASWCRAALLTATWLARTAAKRAVTLQKVRLGSPRHEDFGLADSFGNDPTTAWCASGVCIPSAILLSANIVTCPLSLLRGLWHLLQIERRCQACGTITRAEYPAGLEPARVF